MGAGIASPMRIARLIVLGWTAIPPSDPLSGPSSNSATNARRAACLARSRPIATAMTASRGSVLGDQRPLDNNMTVILRRGRLGMTFGSAHRFDISEGPNPVAADRPKENLRR
jgi:hypothetical protein